MRQNSRKSDWYFKRSENKKLDFSIKNWIPRVGVQLTRCFVFKYRLTRFFENKKKQKRRFTRKCREAELIILDYYFMWDVLMKSYLELQPTAFANTDNLNCSAMSNLHGIIFLYLFRILLPGRLAIVLANPTSAALRFISYEASKEKINC